MKKSKFFLVATVILTLFSLGCGSLVQAMSNNFSSTSIISDYGSITGTIINGTSTASIEVIGPTKKTIKPDGYGVYTITNLLPGTYTLKVSRSGYVTSEVTDVVVVADQVTTCDITLLMLGRVYGKVTSVNIRGASAGSLNYAYVEFNGPVKKTTYSSSDGSYNVEGLPPGKYKVKVTKSGYYTAEDEITVNAGDVLIVPFVLVKSLF